MPADRDVRDGHEMLSIQCDDNTAASIVIDDATEIAMTQEDWEISGRPTIGDTISFDVVGNGMFVDAFKGTQYLVTDEYERDGHHIVSFTDVATDSVMVTDEPWLAYEDVPIDGEGEVYDIDDDASAADAEMELLAEFPGIMAPGSEGSEGLGDTARRMAIKNMPSMRLIGQLMQEHGMSMHDVVAGLIAMENEDRTQTANEDVIVDFFKQNSDGIKDVSRSFSSRGGDTSSMDTSQLRLLGLHK